MPFTAGILTALNFPQGFRAWPVTVLLVLLITLLFYFHRQSARLKHWLLLLTDLFLFFYGLALVQLKDQSANDLFYARLLKPDSSVYFLGLVDELPLEKEKTVKLSLQVRAVKSAGAYHSTRGKVLAYLRKSQLAMKVRAGDELLIRSAPKEVPGPVNPNAFDYKQYLANKQVYHSCFVDSNCFAILPPSHLLNPVWQTGLNCKSFILSGLKNSRLNVNSYAICCALLTGYDDEIDKTVMTAFSHSGTLHVLSVSGLHTGLIYVVLGFLFDLLDRQKKHKLLRFILITLVLWLFALITGFSSPVLRAVLMFNLLGLGKLFFRQDARNQMNILLASAFILLQVDPFFIADVGFQLSYFALAGLIYFQPGLALLWQPRNFIFRSLWQSVCASFAATISTLPFTLFYFKQFPLWFFVCNIVVVPATFVILLLGVLVVLKLGIAGLLINWLIGLLIRFIGFFDHEAIGFIDMIDFDLADALFLSLLTLFVSVAIQNRSYRQVLFSFVVLIAWQISALCSSWFVKQQQLFSAYAVKKKDLFSVKDKTTTVLTICGDNEYQFHLKAHLIAFNHPWVHKREFNCVLAGAEKILLLDKPGYLPRADLSQITRLIVCNNYQINETELVKFSALRQIVSGSSNNKRCGKKIEKLSRKFGLDFYDINRSGAFLLAIQ